MSEKPIGPTSRRHHGRVVKKEIRIDASPEALFDAWPLPGSPADERRAAATALLEAAVGRLAERLARGGRRADQSSVGG